MHFCPYFNSSKAGSVFINRVCSVCCQKVCRGPAMTWQEAAMGFTNLRSPHNVGEENPPSALPPPMLCQNHL